MFFEWFLLPLLFLYLLFDVNYFFRMGLCVASARYLKSRCGLLETTCVTGICLTNDVDTLLSHMNNTRYLRELDFARVDFYERTQLYHAIKSKGGSVYQGAATIRYRRFIRTYHLFKITSQIIYWDEESIYMEHRFIRPSDQFVHSIVICRQRVINCSLQEIMQELMSNNKDVGENNTTTTANTSNADNNTAVAAVHQENPNCHVNINYIQAPEAQPDIIKWIEYNDLSSKKLRQN